MHILHHGLGSFLQAGGEMLRIVTGPKVSEKTLLVYATELGLHVLAPRDETGTKTPTIRPTLRYEPHWPAEGALTLC